MKPYSLLGKKTHREEEVLGLLNQNLNQNRGIEETIYIHDIDTFISSLRKLISVIITVPLFVLDNI